MEDQRCDGRESPRESWWHLASVFVYLTAGLAEGTHKHDVHDVERRGCYLGHSESPAGTSGPPHTNTTDMTVFTNIMLQDAQSTNNILYHGGGLWWDRP